MFGQKYHKQLLKLLPLVEQQGQEQSVQPSNKHNSNDEQSQCFTPNYNNFQEDEQKPCHPSNPQYDNDNVNQQSNHHSNSFFNKDYQRMRQNPNIDYQTFFHRRFDSLSKQTSQNEQAKQVVTLTPALKQDEYDFSPINSSFQQLMDSDIKKNQSGQEKKNDTNNKSSSIAEEENKRKPLSESYYPQLMVNQQPLTQSMLSDPETRWRLLFQLLNLTKQTSQKSHATESMLQILQAISLRNIQSDQSFKSVQKVLEQKVDKVQQTIYSDLAQDVKNKEKAEFLTEYKYEMTKEAVLGKFKQRSTKSLCSLEQSVAKRFQKANLQLIREKRIALYFIDRTIEEASKQEQHIESQFEQTKKSQNQSLVKIESQITQNFTLIQNSLSQTRKQLKSKEWQIEQKLQNIGNRLILQLNKEIYDGKQIEEQLIKLVQGLLDKLG